MGVQTSRHDPATTRLRRSKSHITYEPLLAATKNRKPHSGPWEDDIEKIDGGEKDDNGKLIIRLIWNNVRESKHDAPVVYKKCPQMVAHPFFPPLVY